jgi:HSP20 family protein
MPSSERSNRKRGKAGGRVFKDRRSFRPNLNDFRRKRSGEVEVKQQQQPSPYSKSSSNYLEKKGRAEQRARYMDNIFEDFRNDIESMLNPWSQSYYEPFPSRFGIAESEDEETIRTPLYEMIDEGDRYELKVELPGIERENIHVEARDDSIEISAENTEEKAKRDQRQKRSYIYNQLSYTSAYCAIPFPEEIHSSEVTAKFNNGILQLILPKKVPTKPEEFKGRSIKVE